MQSYRFIVAELVSLQFIATLPLLIVINNSNCEMLQLGIGTYYAEATNVSSTWDKVKKKIRKE